MSRWGFSSIGRASALQAEGQGFNSPKLHMDWSCDDCKVNTQREYYMVWDGIWEEFGCGEGLLCVGCLEARLGRKLDKYDFNKYPINDVNLWDKSDRLKDRLTSGG